MGGLRQTSAAFRVPRKMSAAFPRTQPRRIKCTKMYFLYAAHAFEFHLGLLCFACRTSCRTSTRLYFILLYCTLGLRRGKEECQGVVLSVLFYSTMLYYMLRHSSLSDLSLLLERWAAGGMFSIRFLSYIFSYIPIYSIVFYSTVPV